MKDSFKKDNEPILIEMRESMSIKKRRKKHSTEDIIFNAFNYTLMCLLIVIMLYPFWNTIVVSFNDAMDTMKGGVTVWPRKFTWYNYQNIFQGGTLVAAFWVSVERTLLTTVANVYCSAMVAYVLSRKEFVFRKSFSALFILTMYVSAGLIPQYFLFKDLKLINNFWVYVIPSIIGAYNIIIIRTFINGISASLIDAARIDGAGEFRIFSSIVIPMCKPVLATVALWVAVGSWNNWFDTYIFASSKQNLSTLQYEMMKILSSAMTSGSTNANLMAQAGQNAARVSPNSIRAAVTVVAAVPILVVYPFVQKYFVQGVHVGGVKE